MYWLASIPLFVGYGVANVMTESANEKTALLGYIIMFSLIWPSLAVQTKRWHDRNKSGWWNLILFIPIFGHIYATIELGFLGSIPGTNIYDIPLFTRPSFDNASRPSHDYLSRGSYWEDSNIADKPGESGTLVESGSVKNSWRGR
jgi:hypothetical protein